MNIIRRILNSSRPRGLKFIFISLIFCAVLSFPLILYILFGPSDGNPIGLGLLAALGQLIAYAGCFIGVLLLLIDGMRGRYRRKRIRP